MNPVQQVVKERCLARMVNWWRLAREVLEADFPQYDLLHSFAVFDLDLGVDRVVAGAAQLTEQEEEALDNWAVLLSLNPTALKEQFRQLRGLALAFRENSVDTLEAWQQAILETQATSRRRAAYPVSALLPVLQRYAAYTGSTSGVEQDFSRFKRAIGDHRGNLGSLAEERIAVLASRRTSVDEDLVLAKHARLIWAECFGVARMQQRRKHLPRLLRRRGSSRRASEAAATRSYQKALATLIASDCPGECATAAQAIRKAAKMWGPLQARELTKRNALLRKRKLDAILHGTCINADDTSPAEIAAHAEELRQKRRRLLRKYDAEQVPRKNRELPPGTTVFIDPSLQPCGQDVHNLQGDIASLRWRHVDDRVLAKVLIVKDPAKPSRKDVFVAALGGRLLASSGFVKGHGGGVAIQYGRALRLPRYLWASPACEVEFAAALKVMRDMWHQAGTGDEPPSRWVFDTAERFLARRGRGKGGQRELVALVTQDELTSPGLRQYPGRTTLPAFITRCASIIREGCQAGVLGS